MSSNEEIVISVLKAENCIDEASMISPADLAVKCAEKGLANATEIEAAVVGLIDQDIIEYELNEDGLQTIGVWLL